MGTTSLNTGRTLLTLALAILTLSTKSGRNFGPCLLSLDIEFCSGGLFKELSQLEAKSASVAFPVIAFVLDAFKEKRP
jgi:hypothetical protein